MDTAQQEPRYVLTEQALTWLADREPRAGYNPSGRPSIAGIAAAAGIDPVTFGRAVNRTFPPSSRVMARLTAYGMRHGYSRSHVERTLFDLALAQDLAVAA